MNEQSIFLAALDFTDPAERSAYLVKACAGNTTLLQNVKELLASHEKSGDFLDMPAVKQMAGDACVTMELGASTRDEFDLSYLAPSTKPDSLGTLAHHEIRQVLGQGGFGTVLKAFDEKLHRLVAIKVLSRELAATSPPRKRFLREARSVAAIKNENVIAIHSVEEQPLPYIVMEFVDGGTLQDKMDESGPIEVSEILHIGKQIASGLAAAHALGLIHRDIKPANILLEKGVVQKVKITDFGLARAADDASMTQSGMIAGTPLYMAPEQAKGAKLDARTDLFSLGSVLYAMATGHPPFRAPSTFAVLRRVTEDAPRPMQEVISDIPDWMVAIVDKLLAKEPEDRFQSAQELVDVLAQCQLALQAGVPISAAKKLGVTRLTPPDPLVKGEAKPNKFPVAGVATGVMLMFTVMATGLFFLNKDKNSSTGRKSAKDVINSFRVSQERRLDPATVTVKAKDNEAITMWVLLDCSDSMRKNNIHAMAKATAGQLLKQVMQLNDEGESPLHVGVIVFGRRPDADTPEILKQCAIGNQIFKSAVMKDEQIGQLIDLVESSWIGPSGCTPLYDAIYTACEESKNDGRNWIVVISDGSNDVNLLQPGDKDNGKYYYPQKGNKQVGDIKQKVLETKSSLFVYQFSNDAYYREINADGTQKFLDSQIKKIESNTQELRNLLNEVSPKIAGSFKSKMLYSTFDELSKDLFALLPVSSISIADSNGRQMSEEPIEKQTFGKQITINVPEPTQATITVTSHGKRSKPLPIWLVGGEKLELKYSGLRGLMMIPYKDDSTGFRTSSKPMVASGGSKSKVAAKAATAATAPDRLDIQLSLQGVVAETAEQTTFTRRPSFVVAKICPANTETNQAFWVCDHSFRPKTHYPVVQLPYIPWQENNDWRSDAVDIGVWLSDEVPKNASTVKLKPGDQKDEAKLRFVRTDNQITVTRSEGMDSHLVMCTTAIKTIREYSGGRETKIVFDVSSSSEAEISIVNQSQLTEWENEGTLRYYYVSELKFVK